MVASSVSTKRGLALNSEAYEVNINSKCIIFLFPEEYNSEKNNNHIVKNVWKKNMNKLIEQ